MAATRLEDLPNELWLELFVYFTWVELRLTWLEWKLNSRIQTLAQVAHTRVAFEISSMPFRTYGQCLYYFEHEHPTMAYRITSLLLNESVLSNEIVRQWLENGTSFFPRIRRCTIYYNVVSRYVQSKIVRLIRQNASVLRHVVFYFDTSAEYERILKRIIKQRISLHTMQLIILEEDECYWMANALNEDFLYHRLLFAFPNTVRLRLSLQRICDFALLVQRDTLPRIEHLHVTLEKSAYEPFQLYNRYKDSSVSTLCSKDVNSSQADLPHLRTLHLQQVSISDVIVLIQHLPSMSQLESLILVNCHVKDKNELITLKNSIKTFLVCLRHLHFVLYLPVETKLEQSDLYWFDLNHHAVEYEINDLMLLYTVPYLLSNQRQVHNRIFGRRSTINNKINHIQWTVDYDPLSVNTTLTQFQNVNSLQLYYDIKEMNPNSCSWSVILPVLRNVELNFDWNPMTKKLNGQYVTPIAHRYIILDQLRQYAPSLQCLTLWWHDVRLLLNHPDSPWPSVQQLNILLRTHEKDDPSVSLIKRLPTTKVFPQLQYLSFGSRRFSLTPPELAAERILSWLDALVSPSSKLLILHVNRYCSYFRTLSPTNHDILMMLLKQHISLRNYHHSSAKIIVDSNEEVIIWL